MAQRIGSYPEFWPYYLRQHAKPATRYWHFAGTTLAIAGLIALVASADPWFFLVAAAGGYGPAWYAHFFVEKNRPATFTYPFWSLFSDFRMYFFWLAGRLDGALAEAGVRPDGTVESQGEP